MNRYQTLQVEKNSGRKKTQVRKSNEREKERSCDRVCFQQVTELSSLLDASLKVREISLSLLLRLSLKRKRGGRGRERRKRKRERSEKVREHLASE